MIQNNDSLITPFFKNVAIQDMNASKEAGRPIFKDMTVCEVRIAGDRNFAPVVPAHSMWKRIDGEEVTYAERWAAQYQRFMENAVQVADGTPLSELPFLTEAKRQELRALKVYTAEALASLDGKNLNALGAHGRELKNKATAYLENASGSATVTKLAEKVAQLEALLAEQGGPAPVLDAAPAALAEPADEDERETLKARYAELTGARPRGNPSIETLRNMVAEAQG